MRTTYNNKILLEEEQYIQPEREREIWSFPFFFVVVVVFWGKKISPTTNVCVCNIAACFNLIVLVGWLVGWFFDRRGRLVGSFISFPFIEHSPSHHHRTTNNTTTAFIFRLFDSQQQNTSHHHHHNHHNNIVFVVVVVVK